MSETRKVLKDAGLLNSYWGKIILEAEARGGFNPDQTDEAEEWPTCACGHQSPNIPRHQKNKANEEAWTGSGEPKDEVLKMEGVEFSGYVDHNLYLGAAECLVRIETRSAEVMGIELEKYVARSLWHLGSTPSE